MPIEIRGEAKDRLIEALDAPLLRILNDHEWKIFCAPEHDEIDQYEHMRRGGCMLCGEKLGEDTIIIVDAQGVLGLFCSADCVQDVHIIPYLNEQLEEKLTRLMPED